MNRKSQLPVSGIFRDCFFLGAKDGDAEGVEFVDWVFVYLLFFLTKKVGKKVKANTMAPPVLPSLTPFSIGASFFLLGHW